MHDNGSCTTKAVNQMHTWCKTSTSSLGGLHICMPAQGLVKPLTALHTRKHYFSQLHLRQPQKTYRNLQHISAVDEEQSTQISHENKQAGARTCKGHRPQLVPSLQPPSLFLGAAKTNKDPEKPQLKQSQPEGELQLLPNRRFFLAALGSLTIGNETQPTMLQLLHCCIAAWMQLHVMLRQCW